MDGVYTGRITRQITLVTRHANVTAKSRDELIWR